MEVVVASLTRLMSTYIPKIILVRAHNTGRGKRVGFVVADNRWG